MSTIKSNNLFRAGSFARGLQIEEDNRTVELSFSSDYPVERHFGMEILRHSAEAIDFSRLNNGAAVMVDHEGDQVGVVEKAWLGTDGRGYARLRFGNSQRSRDVFADVKDGIRQNISFGYQIQEMEEQTGENDNTRAFVATRWMPYEISVVAVPADPTIGVGRSAGEEFEIQVRSTKPSEEAMEEVTPAAEEVAAKDEAVEPVEEVRSAEETPAEETAPEEAADPVAERNEEVKEIMSIGRKFDMADQAVEAIAQGDSLDTFRSFVIEKTEVKPMEQVVKPVTDLGMSDKEIRKYSLMKAIRAMATNDWSEAGYERELSMEISDKLGRDAKGLFIPFDVQRAQSVGTATAGGNLVGTDLRADLFIDSLREESLLGKLGATFLPGLVGDVSIPRQTGNGSFGFITEGSDANDTELSFDNVTLSPKTVAGGVPMTRKVLKQSSPFIEQLVRADIMKGMAAAIDNAALLGSGAGGNPTGIALTSGINTLSLATVDQMTYAEAVAAEEALQTDNALVDNAKWLVAPKVKTYTKTNPMFAGTATPIYADGQINEYDALCTSKVGADCNIFGNFADLLIGMWGVLDLDVDQATLAKSGGLVLRAFQDIDVAVRNPESFVKASFA